MEAKDSATTAAPAVVASSRDGSVDEDGGSVTVANGLAREAAGLFQNRHYADCIDVLKQLLLKKDDDPRVLHNIAVAEYFLDGCPNPRKLLDALTKVKERCEILAHASGLQLEVSGNLGSSGISGARGSGNNTHQHSVPNSIYADELDSSVVTLNKAIIMYHLHEYASVRSLVEPLYQNLEPIDETTALHVCLLLLDVALASQDATLAADLIQYLERAFGVGSVTSTGDNTSVSQQTLKTSTASGLTPPDASGSDSSAVNALENHPAGALLDDAMEYESLMTKLGNNSENLEMSNDISRTVTEKPSAANDLKLKLQLYKVQFLLLTRNLKVAKREVKQAMNIARGRDSSMALILKSQLEYARGNHKKAIKLLQTSTNRTEAGIAPMFDNNLGCIYHRLRKHHLSNFYFSRALRSSYSLISERPLKLTSFSQDKSLLIFYNCGLQHLACEKPLVAARCFHRASLVLSKLPLLWLRLAECCILALEKGLLLSGDASNSEEAKINIVGSGKFRKLAVEAKSENRTWLTEAQDGLLSDDPRYRLSIPFARQCLLNTLHLLNGLESKSSKAAVMTMSTECDDSNEATSIVIKNANHKTMSGADSRVSNATSSSVTSVNADLKESKGGSSSSVSLQSSISAYDDLLKQEYHMMKQTALADLAFVELCLENPWKSLWAAKSLQELPGCSRLYIFLGHVYAAEALCHLNRFKEAAEHLSVYLSDSNTVELPYSDEIRQRWSSEKGGDSEEVNGSTQTPFAEPPQGSLPLKPEEARGLLYVDLAAMSASQGDLDQAGRFVTAALSIIPDHPRALLAAVYLDLLLQKSQDAIAKLKQCRYVRFFPSTSSVSQ